MSRFIFGKLPTLVPGFIILGSIAEFGYAYLHRETYGSAYGIIPGIYNLMFFVMISFTAGSILALVGLSRPDVSKAWKIAGICLNFPFTLFLWGSIIYGIIYNHDTYGW